MKEQLGNMEWKEFLFLDIFKIKKGFYNKKPISSNSGKIPFLGATANNNGITELYTLKEINDNSRVGYGKNEPLGKKIFQGNCIAVTNNGSVGHAYYQVTDFTCSHDINPLYLKNYRLNRLIALFLISAIEKQKVCFEYARKWRPIRMVKSKILLPVTTEGQPHYNFMEEYMREKEQEKINVFEKQIFKRLEELRNYREVIPLAEKEWGDFFVADISEIISGKDIYEVERKKGNFPYVTSTANNNGIGYFVGNNNQTFEANCVSVNRNGSVGYAFYHQYSALFSNDCRKLRLNNPSKFVGIFISQQITKQKEKYGYGYKMGTARLKRQKIMLPIDTSGQPDYEFMEHYMKKIEYQKLMAFLEVKNIFL